MAHFAKLDENNIVLEVVVVNNAVVQNLPFPDSEPLGIAFLHSLYGDNAVWKQTSYNDQFRGLYAGIGFIYDPAIDEFVVPPRPINENLSEIQDRVGALEISPLSESEQP
jgi:hypothetical protein